MHDDLEFEFLESKIGARFPRLTFCGVVPTTLALGGFDTTVLKVDGINVVAPLVDPLLPLDGSGLVGTTGTANELMAQNVTRRAEM